MPAELGLAVIEGLADDVEIAHTDGWPQHPDELAVRGRGELSWRRQAGPA